MPIGFIGLIGIFSFVVTQNGLMKDVAIFAAIVVLLTILYVLTRKLK
jgi:hypothetical protein